MVNNSRGSLHVALLLALVVISSASFGVWGLLRHWRHIAELQLRLDRCVGETALDLKKTLVRIEKENLGIRALRVAVIAAAAVGQAGEARALLEVAVLFQDMERVTWKAKQLKWLALRGCGQAGDLPRPLPTMNWERPPEDAIGAQALSWEPGAPRMMRVEVAHLPRAAAAEVSGESNEIRSEWKAKWASAP